MECENLRYVEAAAPYYYYCALCLSPLLGGPVRPAPSEFDGGVLALVRI